MADSVKFTIIIEQKIDDKKLEKIKKELKKEVKKEAKKGKTVKKQVKKGKIVKKQAKKEAKKKEVKKGKIVKKQAKKEAKKKEVKKGKNLVVTSRSPISPPPETQNRGGIFGGRTDPPVKGFQKRKGIRGGVERQRDDRSKSPIQAEKFNDMIAKLENKIESNYISSRAAEGIIKNHMGNLVKGSAILSNPQGFIGNSFVRMLSGAGPHGALVVAAITAPFLIQKVSEEVIKTLAQKGLPLNRDWRREIEEEVNGLFSIEDKKKRLLGIDSYIVTQTDRYQPDSGSQTVNSYENRDEVIISKLGNYEKAIGVI